MSSLADLWGDFADIVGDEASDLAGDLFRDWKGDARHDAKDFIALVEEKLPLWSDALQAGQMTKLEFELLVKSLATLAELNALKGRGLANQKLEKFRQGLIGIVVNATFRVLGL